MAKNTPKPAEVAGPVTLEEAPADAVEMLPVAEASEPAKPTKFRVQLSAHTPIEHNDVTLEAENEADAKAKFCALNGITDSTCPWTITEVKE